MLKCTKELLNFAAQNHKECKVAVLPDFFLDRFINLDWNIPEFSRLITDVAARKGGSIDGIRQTDMQGGNAVNVASALTNLGAEVNVIVCTSQYGLQQLKQYFGAKTIDTSHVKVRERASVTTALEFKNNSEKTNVMIRDLGSLANFGPDDLTEADYSAIDDADYACVFNWAGTLKNGTALAQVVFSRAKKGLKAKTYFDTADPTPNKEKIAELIEKVLKSHTIDVLSLNENEAIIYASLLDKTLNDKREQFEFSDLALEAARVLAKNLQVRIDLHTTAFAATLNRDKEVVVPAFDVKVLRATGAGDAWTAGNIIGDHNGLNDECRLTLANAVSAYYLSDPEGQHPTMAKLSKFLSKV
jgi:sugar/nucleoside kinase (ribokinase family)